VKTTHSVGLLLIILYFNDLIVLVCHELKNAIFKDSLWTFDMFDLLVLHYYLGMEGNLSGYSCLRQSMQCLD
jgi:hypothetical protein